MGLDENDIGIDLDDLMQEGSIGLLNAIPLFDAGRGMKFLTYAAPALRNAMTDCMPSIGQPPQFLARSLQSIFRSPFYP
ncbi:sigma factor [Faecalibacterium sp. i25-0019-C1]|uniref:sigma factor n=1 Tax=Faecalibacterium sp. i25-0019-C1 TaxID=3141185 RepID=UPI0036F35305